MEKGEKGADRARVALVKADKATGDRVQADGAHAKAVAVHAPAVRAREALVAAVGAEIRAPPLRPPVGTRRRHRLNRLPKLSIGCLG